MHTTSYMAALVVLMTCACAGRSLDDGRANGGSGGTTISRASGGGADASSGSNGGSAAGECATAAACPEPNGPCQFAICAGGRCSLGNTVQGTFVSRHVPADCFDTVCDGRGGEANQVDVGNTPSSNGGGCALYACDESGMVSVVPVAAGASCMSAAGGKLCDGTGQCVPCLISSDCPANQACVMHECAPTSCTDGLTDGAETDVDCGGSGCPACGSGKNCVQGADCASNVCDAASHTCAGSSCQDGKLNGNETDLDCGGSCPPCALSKDCFVDQDCVTQACDAVAPHRCVSSHCVDHRVDADETSFDCGGSCAPCADGQFCKVNQDCQSGDCDVPRGSFCLDAQCLDGQLDGDETDLDCGGGSCDGCALGKKCEDSSDCQSRACDATSLTCIADHCLDQRVDGDETGTDCGGPTCSPCGQYMRCKQNTDCAAPYQCSVATPSLCE